MGAIADYKLALKQNKQNRLDLLSLLFCCYVDTLTQTCGDEQIRYSEEFKAEIVAFFEELEEE